MSEIWEEIERIVQNKEIGDSYKEAIERGDWKAAHDILFKVYSEDLPILKEVIDSQREQIKNYLEMYNTAIEQRNSARKSLKKARQKIMSMKGGTK